MERKASRITRSYTHELHALPETAFPLLCPVREYEWIERWQCEMVYSASGIAEQGCVFRTDFPGDGLETWVLCRYEPPKRIEFVRVSQDRTIHYVIELQRKDDGRTLITWTQEHTALTEAGSAGLAELSAEVYAHRMRFLNGLLDHYLITGQMLPFPAQAEA